MLSRGWHSAATVFPQPSMRAQAFQLREAAAAAAAAEMHGRRDEEALVRVLLLLSWQFESCRAGPIHTEHALDAKQNGS